MHGRARYLPPCPFLLAHPTRSLAGCNPPPRADGGRRCRRQRDLPEPVGGRGCAGSGRLAVRARDPAAPALDGAAAAVGAGDVRRVAGGLPGRARQAAGVQPGRAFPTLLLLLLRGRVPGGGRARHAAGAGAGAWSAVGAGSERALRRGG